MTPGILLCAGILLSIFIFMPKRYSVKISLNERAFEIGKFYSLHSAEEMVEDFRRRSPDDDFWIFDNLLWKRHSGKEE